MNTAGKISRKRKVALVIMVATLSWLFSVYKEQGSAGLTEGGRQNFLAAVANNSSSQNSLSLITEPDDGMGRIQDAVGKAARSLDLVIYELEDPEIEQALVAAKDRGVSVRVILQNVDNFGKYPNAEAYKFLQNNGVAVQWAPDYFALTHEKTLIVDGVSAIIMTFNFNPKYYAGSRDFAVVDTNPTDVAAISVTFDADWNGRGILAPAGNDLLWSPGSADILLSIINSATSSLDIYNEEMADLRIMDALESAAKRGVNVRVEMTYATNWKPALDELVSNGVTAHTFSASANLYIHAKVIVSDAALAFVGSENFSEPSLDKNRELGIVLSKPDIISTIENAFNKDWAGSRPFALERATTTPDVERSIVKLSTSKICHAPGDSSYDRTKKFTPYDTVQDCLDAGGRLPLGTK